MKQYLKDNSRFIDEVEGNDFVTTTHKNAEGSRMFEEINLESKNLESGSENGYTLNKTAVIEYTVPQDCKDKRTVSLKLYDILGNLVIKLVEEEKDPGRHKCEFESDTIANGIYLCEFRVGDYSAMKQLILQR